LNDILIKNACVIDPLNSVDHEIMDILISKGRIVDSVGSDATVIDAGGSLTLPGGIDSHTHVCGTKVNFGRYMSPEDMRAGRTPRKGPMHATSGYSVPTTYGTSYRYSVMGYTTLLEGAMAPLEARHTHEEFAYTPLQDTMANVLFDGNWALFDAIANHDVKRAAAVIAWFLKATKGFAVKLTNPGGTDEWGWGRDVNSIQDQLGDFGITPADIITYSIRANELLNLPHSVHLHCNLLGKPGNYECTRETFELVPDLNKNRQSLYATHVQYHSYGGTGWNDFCSKADEVSGVINNTPQIVIDMGQVMFGKTTTMTADGPMEFNLYRLYNNKWSNHDVELETGSGIIPVYYRKSNLVNSIMWAIGLELALLVEDPWQCIIATDNPNGAPFVKYPEIIALLMSKQYRDMEMATIHRDTENRTILTSIERELDWYDIAVKTRAAQAKALGIIDLGKGHLGEGADADIAIYPMKIDEIDPSHEWQKVIDGFSKTEYTIKGGQVVAKNGDCVLGELSSTIWTKPRVPHEYDMSNDEKFMNNFEYYYTVRMSNYPVQDDYLYKSICIETEADL